MYIYMYTDIYVCIYTFLYIYILYIYIYKCHESPTTRATPPSRTKAWPTFWKNHLATKFTM